jgi:hypothetical protein
VTGSDPFAVAVRALDRVLDAGGDLVTLLPGHGADELGARVVAHLAATRPAVEVHAHPGGQHRPVLVAGVE